MSSKLAHDGPYYQLSLLPDQWRPPMHEHGDIKVDVSAVGPWMTTMAGEVADGVHVHPLHSVHYLEQRLIPAVQAGAAKAGRSAADVDLLIPVFIVPGDTPEERDAARPAGPDPDRVLRLDAGTTRSSSTTSASRAPRPSSTSG